MSRGLRDAGRALGQAPLEPRFGLAPALAKATWGHVGDEPLPAGPSRLVVHAARNQVVGAQVRVAAAADFVLTTDRAGWLHRHALPPRIRLEVAVPGLPEDAVETLVVGWVEGDDRSEWMEILDPSGHAESPAFRPAVAYLRIRVPAGARSGPYEGTVRAMLSDGFEDETLVWTGSIVLEVSEVVLPDPADWAFDLDLWQHLTSVAVHHRVPLWGEAHFALIDRYYASLAALGQKAVTVVATEIPWVGQYAYRGRRDTPYYFEHAVVAVRRDAAGGLVLDFAVLDRLLDLAHRHGIDHVIEVFGLLHAWTDEPYGLGRVIEGGPSAVRIRVTDEATGEIGWLRDPSELRSFVAALHDHLVARGVIDRVRVAADEPGRDADLSAELALLREAGPRFRYSVALSDGRVLGTLPGDFVDCCLALAHVPGAPGFARTVRARGGRATFYTCGAEPFPNTFVHSPLVEAALMGWIADAWGLDGYLRWAFCLWPADPWRRVTTAAANPPWAAGDTHFVLPGPAGGPVETLRYEALRAGIQDFELLRLLRSRGGPAAEAAIEAARSRLFRAGAMDGFAQVGAIGVEVPTTVRPSDLYSLDPLDHEAARQILLAALEEVG